MNTNFVRACVCGLVINRSLFFSRTVYSYALVSCVFIVLLHQQVAAQYNPRETPKPAWNGRDPVIHRPGDEPYALYHMASPYPHVRKTAKRNMQLLRSLYRHVDSDWKRSDFRDTSFTRFGVRTMDQQVQLGFQSGASDRCHFKSL